ncbi:ATP-dependent Clp protease adapter ClpS [Candidatus Poriferisodalis sp.]|uniref:ATP-dependent Clp protease adapter ClpS n=1 Tax=Candidatus Poriferisodalis sp. TaxID=3101277 RepID=UPI003B52EFA0
MSSASADAIAVLPRLANAPAVAEPDVIRDPTTEDSHSTDVPWVVLVWNDPINLMSYVVYVFQKLFGYSEAKATELMLDVHNKGRAAVAWGAREKAELDVFRLHEYGLWATMQKDN